MELFQQIFKIWNINYIKLYKPYHYITNFAVWWIWNSIFGEKMFSIVFSALGKCLGTILFIVQQVYFCLLFSVSVVLAPALQVATLVRIFKTFVHLNCAIKTEVVNNCLPHNRISPTITTAARS